MPKPRSTKKSTALDAKQKELLEQEQKLRDQFERLQSMIAEAPKKREAIERTRREEIIHRNGPYLDRFDTDMAISRKRYNADTASRRPRRRMLKAERFEAQIKFLALCILLTLIVLFIYIKFFS